MEITYTASDRVREVIASLGRTEDVRFSPSNRRLALTAFRHNAVVVFDIDMTCSAGRKEVALTRAAQFSSPALDYPHGLDFLDEETVVVASRGGDMPILKLPLYETPSGELSSARVLRAGKLPLWNAPGSVSAYRTSEHSCETLVCNAGANTVTRHRVDFRAGCALESSNVLLKKWLDIPDGVTVSADGQWIAISNHNAHNVLLYRNSPSLDQQSDPDGMLRSLYYPHGLRFSSDGRRMFVADAGSPYVFVYENDGTGWDGVHNPIGSFRVMDDALYLRGRTNPKEGGPKGIDIDRGMNVLVATCECQPLAFFDLPALLESSSIGLPSGSRAADQEQRAFAMRFELDVMRRLNKSEDRAVQAQNRAYNAEGRAAHAEAAVAQLGAKLELAETHAAEAIARAAKANAKAARASAKAVKANAKAAKAKTKAAKAKARAGFVIGGTPWRITAPLSRLFYALKRPN
jgi:hypothetical protein